MRSDSGASARGRAHHASRPAAGLVAVAISALVATTSCSGGTPGGDAAILDPGRMSSVVVGRSSRADVFAALGRPSRTQRSAVGEDWIYEVRETDPGAGQQGVMSGMASAAGIVGAVVPYAGLVGSGRGLANTAIGGSRREPLVTSLAVAFGPDGVVRDCVYTSTALPTGIPGSRSGVPVVDCRRPPTGVAPTS